MPRSLKVRTLRALVALLALTTTTVAVTSQVATAGNAVINLAITKTDGVTTVSPGGSLTYTIAVTNFAPSANIQTTVSDILPAALSGSWTCAGAGNGTCPSAGTGSISASVYLPVGGSVTFTLSVVVSAQATGTISNTATVNVPGDIGVQNYYISATDVDTIVPLALTDLSITKTDGVTSVAPGGSLTYTITVTNSGPTNAAGTTVTDNLPATLTSSWTCVGSGGGACLGSGSGSGSINATVNLPAGGSVTFTVNAVLSAQATGTLSNTATVKAPSGVTDQNPANNSATDTDTIAQAPAPGADLGITKALVGGLQAGANATYKLTITNFGPGTMTDTITVVDVLPAALSYVSAGGPGWSCGHSAATITCTTDDDLAKGASSVITVVVLVASTATGTIVNKATVDAGGTAVDSSPANDTATASDAILPAIPQTGTDSAPLAMWALALIGLGLLTSAAARRRATTRR